MCGAQKMDVVSDNVLHAVRCEARSCWDQCRVSAFWEASWGYVVDRMGGMWVVRSGRLNKLCTSGGISDHVFCVRCVWQRAVSYWIGSNYTLLVHVLDKRVFFIFHRVLLCLHSPHDMYGANSFAARFLVPARTKLYDEFPSQPQVPRKGAGTQFYIRNVWAFRLNTIHVVVVAATNGRAFSRHCFQSVLISAPEICI